MELRKIELLNKYKEYEAGTVLEVDETVAETLIDSKAAKAWNPDATHDEEEARKKAEENRKNLQSMIRAELSQALKEGAKAAKDVYFVQDNSDNDPTGGFGPGEFVRDVWRAGNKGGHVSEKLQKHQDKAQQKLTEMNENVDAEGGFLVPIQQGDLWFPPALAEGIVGPRAMRIPMQTNRIEIPAMVDEDHSTNFFGGVILYRTAEGAQKTKSQPKFRQIALTLNSITALVGATNQLMEDSPVSVEAILNQSVPLAIAFQQDDDYINGTGSGQALGMINTANASLIAVTAEVGQPADTIVFENLVKMLARFKVVNPNAVTWIANQDTYPQLATMSMAVGTGGIPVWLPANGAADRPFPTLFGWPIIFTEKVPTIGDQGDIALIDWSQYFIGDKGGIKTASSEHIWFDYNEQAFRFEVRYDGRPAWNSALTPLRSANTLSPSVVIAAR